MRNNTQHFFFPSFPLMFSYSPLFYSLSHQKSANQKSIEIPVYPSENCNYIIKKYRKLASVPERKVKPIISKNYIH